MTNQEAINMLKNKMDGHTDTSYEWAETVRMSIKALEQELKTGTGHWVGMGEYPYEVYECDNCGFIHTFIEGPTAQYNYCPRCGAKMEEPNESEV